MTMTNDLSTQMFRLATIKLMETCCRCRSPSKADARSVTRKSIWRKQKDWWANGIGPDGTATFIRSLSQTDVWVSPLIIIKKLNWNLIRLCDVMGERFHVRHGSPARCPGSVWYLWKVCRRKQLRPRYFWTSYKWHSTARMCCQDWMSGIKTIITNRYGRRSIPATQAGKCNHMLSTACHKAFEIMARLMEDKH